MHTDHHHHPVRHDGPELVPVHFEFNHATATTVSVAGTFNDWHPHAKPLHKLDGGHWSKETVLPPGIYEYCLVVDGRWLPDPLAKETVANPFGGRNSVLRVTAVPAAVPASSPNPATAAKTNQKRSAKP